MWELLALLVEGALDLLDDLFEDTDDVGELADTVAPVEAVLPVEAGSGDSALAAFDGGISSDRWDPGPVAGPFTP